MEALTEKPFSVATRTWFQLTKPGIVFGNAVTGFTGYAMAAKGHFDIPQFLAVLGGLCCIVASACVFNNYIDRGMDLKMARTRERALAQGLIVPKHALLFGIALGIAGSALLFLAGNLLALSIALFGHLVYVFWYSPAKYRSVYGTLIGSIAGAIPPVACYTALTGSLDGGAFLLFAVIVFWQMPHFYAIAIYRREDYAAASIPVLPIIKGLRTTKIHMLLYAIGFLSASSLLTFFSFTGIAWLSVSSLLGLVWIGMGIQGFSCKDDKKWARKMFLFSLVIVMGQAIVIPFSTV